MSTRAIIMLAAVGLSNVPINAERLCAQAPKDGFTTADEIGLEGFKRFGTKPASDNVAALRAHYGEFPDSGGDGWQDRLELVIPGDIYYLNAPVHFAARSGVPIMRGMGGEPTVHPESQYDVSSTPQYTSTGTFNASTRQYEAGSAIPGNFAVGSWVYGVKTSTLLWVARVETFTPGQTKFTVDPIPLYGTYSTESGFTVSVFSARGGPATIFAWDPANDSPRNKVMFNIYGFGARMTDIHGVGKPMNVSGVALIQDGENPSPWAASTMYSLGATVKQDRGGITYKYICVRDGTSSTLGPANHPSIAPTADDIPDGSVRWNHNAYPHTSPQAAHPGDSSLANEDRCRYFLTINSTQGLGSGKHMFTTMAPILFQTGVYISDNPNIGLSFEHGDQCQIQRFTPNYCDVGIHCVQRQSFAWLINHTELFATRWGFVFDRGGKWQWNRIDLGGDCDIAIYIRGDDDDADETGTGPDEYVCQMINIDESSPANAMILKIDPTDSDVMDTDYAAVKTTFEQIHIPFSRATGSRDLVYTDTGGDFDSSTRIWGPGSNLDLSKVSGNDWIEIRTDGAPLPTCITKVKEVDDSGDDMELSLADVIYGSLPGNLNNNATVHVYSHTTERPFAEIIDSYGYHAFRNLHYGYTRMIRVKGGTQTHYPTIVIDGGSIWGKQIMFRGNSDAESKQFVADLFTTDSTGYVQVLFTNVRQEGTNESNSGRYYRNVRAYGQLNATGHFSADNANVDTWP